jgi:NAD(P)-dependent dehydrogenase (short-subunit alcohol dehydrogenase family)
MTERLGLWHGKVAVITGAAQGIGAAIVDVGLREGATAVWFFDVDGERGAQREAVLRAAGADATFLRVDVTDERAVDAAVGRVVERHGRIDVLVNNAGRDAHSDARTMTSAEWDDFMALDLKSSWLCAKAVLPGMVQSGGGAIVNIASIHATLTAERYFPYAAAKAGLVGLTRSLALDFGPLGVRVNAVNPGFTLTGRVQAAFDAEGEGALSEARERHPLRRLGRPEEVGEVVVFLASDRAAFVTGSAWDVDGGLGSRFA